MQIRGLVWAGTATDTFDETVRFFRDTLGLETFQERGDLAILKLESGEWVEVFGPGDEHYAWFNTGPVVEFLVDDVHAACAELQAAGIELLAEPHGWGDYEWAHFRAPDGKVWGLASGPFGRAESPA